MSTRIIKCSRNAEIKILTTDAGKTIIISEPDAPSKVPIVEPLDYNERTKNQLVKLLNSRGIEHNKRQVKDELVALLEEDDKV